MYFESSLGAKAKKFFRLVLGLYAFPPRDITVEVTTRCDRGCAVCFRRPLGVKELDMPAELFSRAVAEIRAAYGGKGPAYLNFVGLGEPFLHPGLGKMLRLAHAGLPGTLLNVSTGLSPFDRRLFEELVREGVLNRLSVSLDCLDAETGLHSFTGEVRGNLEFLAAFRRGSPGFRIRVQTLISSSDTVMSAAGYAANMGADELQLMRMDLHAFGENPPLPRPGLAEERAIVSSVREFCHSRGLACRNNNSYNVFMDIASAGGARCLTSDDHIFISASGDVLPCFRLRGSPFGNIASMPLRDICAGRKRSDFYGRQKRLCASCDIYRKEHLGEGA